MPADWSLPVNTTAYASVLSDLDAKDRDAITLCYAGDPSNIPTGAKKWNTSTNRLQQWNGTAWVDLVLDIGSGGTGGATASAARTALGLGTLAIQNANAVSITGGVISGATLVASDLSSGLVPQARLGTGSGGLGQNFLADNQTWIPATAPPVGLICPWPAALPPSGWLICDGSAISRTVYSALFALIGTTFGAGDGSTTFNIPNCQGKFILGKAASGTGSTLAGTGGSIDHTHTSAAHSHTISSDGAHTHTVASHTHTVSSDGSHSHGGATGATDIPHAHTFNVTSDIPSSSTDRAQGGTGAIVPVASHTHNVSGTTAGSTSSLSHTHSISTDGSHSHTGATGAASPATDSQGAHTHGAATGTTTPGATGSNNPPFLTLNYVIKT